MGALLAFALQHIEDMRRFAEGLVQKEPSEAERVIASYLHETREASIWEDVPTRFPDSRRQLVDRFEEHDPRVPHRFQRASRLAFIPQVVDAPVLFSGPPVVTLGRVAAWNIMRVQPSPEDKTELNVVWILQLVPVSNKRSLMYCRLTDRPSRRFRTGELVYARGVLVAAGSVRLAQGGFVPGAYLACSAVARPHERASWYRDVPPLPPGLRVRRIGGATFVEREPPGRPG